MPLAYDPAPPPPPYRELFCAYESPVWKRALGEMCDCKNTTHGPNGCTTETHMHHLCGPCQA